MSDDSRHDGPRRVGQVKEVTSLANPIIKDIKALSLILARVEVDFVAQIHYGREVSVRTWIERVGTSSFVVCHEASQDGHMVARGKAVQVYFDFALQKSGPLPAKERAALEGLVQSAQENGT